MKKFTALLLALCMIVCLAACGNAKTAVGTWKGKINLVEFSKNSGNSLGDIAAYLKDADIDMTLELNKDNTFTLKSDGTKLGGVVKEGMRQYLLDTLKKEGLTEAQFQSYFGMTVDQFVDQSMKDLDMNSFNHTFTGTYTDEAGKLTLQISGGKTLTGTWSDNSLTLDADSLGIVNFTR